jgi:hypothetical protein
VNASRVHQTPPTKRSSTCASDTRSP